MINQPIPQRKMIKIPQTFPTRRFWNSSKKSSMYAPKWILQVQFKDQMYLDCNAYYRGQSSPGIVSPHVFQLSAASDVYKVNTRFGTVYLARAVVELSHSVESYSTI